ncbi:MAG: electron transport complex subunit RsxB [Gammaproteobacteria bacterium AqS3]|nr:electron transport complex subunit RsxB [Gammaproteobacteria bacterium AqS3]
MDVLIAQPWIAAVLVLGLLGVLIGALLGVLAERLKTDDDSLVEQINAILPQTQCGQCGYPGCRPYATAIAEAGESINKCPPGGAAGIAKLAELLGVAPEPLDAEHGVEDVARVAYIREDECIGCTKCIQACPVDAILGSAQLMHTVIADECTGCDLCVEPCPVDCIDMIEAPVTLERWVPENPKNLIASDRGRW